MTHLKMTGDFYDDVEKVNEAIGYLKGMIDFLEKECMERDKGKPATGSLHAVSEVHGKPAPRHCSSESRDGIVDKGK